MTIAKLASGPSPARHGYSPSVPRLDHSLQRRALIAPALAACLSLLVAACDIPSQSPAASPATSAAPASVVLIGDSLAQETAPYLSLLLGNTPVVDQFFGGTAPCDWLGKDLATGTTTVAVITFIGNSQTPCMADAAGGFPAGQALVDKYRTDLTELVAQVRATGSRVLMVGQPQRLDPAAEIEIAGINTVVTELATGDEAISFVDGGAAVENPDGSFAVALPCLVGEAECGADGSNIVRNDDGVHMCPGNAALPCPVYSSGAYRFATAIVNAVRAL